MAYIRKAFNQYRTANPFTIHIEGSVAIGSSGAVGTQTGKGFTVTRTGTGAYTITLDAQNGVFAILRASAGVIHSTARLTQLKAVSASAGTLTIQVTDTTFTNADPASGAVLQFDMVIQNKTAF